MRRSDLTSDWCAHFEHRARPPAMTLTDTQRAVFVAALENDHSLGDVAALRIAGVEGTAGQLRGLIAADPDLREDAWQARGWDDTPALSALAAVAIDPSHRFWNSANERWLKLRGHRDPQRVELTGADGGPLAIDDRSASLSDVADVLTTVGAFATHSGGTASPEVSGAGEVLAAPTDG